MTDRKTATPDVIERYFAYDANRDIDSLMTLFAADATVTDEGKTRHGTPEIHAWQLGPASKYTYTTEVKNTRPIGPDQYIVAGRLTGNFPSGTADLKWDFTITDGQISNLVIAP